MYYLTSFADKYGTFIFNKLSLTLLFNDNFNL